MKILSLTSTIILFALVAIIPVSVIAGTPQEWTTPPKIVINKNQDSLSYKVDFSYKKTTGTCVIKGGSYDCNKEENIIDGLDISHSEILNIIIGGKNITKFSIDKFVVYNKLVGDLLNCDILNYNIGGKNSIIINVNKQGCGIS